MTTQEARNAQELTEAGWHRDPAEPRRWRSAAFPELEPQTATQALAIVRGNAARQANDAHGDGAPPRTH